MMSRIVQSLLALCLALAVSTIAARTAQASPEYERMVAQAKKDPAAVDFVALRQAYLRSTGYSGYKRLNEKEPNVAAAASAGDFVQAERLINEMLAECYVRMQTHLVATVMYDMKGDKAKADFHKATAHRIFNALISTGNGRSPQTAFRVVNIVEEYDLMQTWRLRRGVKRLINADNRTFDVWDVSSEERPGETFQLYFDVTPIIGSFNRELNLPQR